MQGDSTKNDADDDAGLFQDAMDGVDPMQSDNKVRYKAEPKKIRVKHRPHNSISLKDVFSDAPVEDCPDQLSFSRSGVQPSTLKKLRQGKLAIDHEIDLHGMTIDEARDYLLEFLGECEVDDSRVLLIVHGKGYSSPGTKPVIKPMVNRWLRELSSVLAFVSAKPADGGTGAVYVLLRK